MQSKENVTDMSKVFHHMPLRWSISENAPLIAWHLNSSFPLKQCTILVYGTHVHFLLHCDLTTKLKTSATM